MVQLLTFAALLIVLNFAVDTLYGGFPQSKPVAGLKQGLTGA